MQAMNELIEQPKSNSETTENENETTETNTQEQDDKATETNPFTTGAICLADLAHEPLPKVEYVVERLALAPGRPTVIYGQSGRGKTLFTSYIASCVALNLPLFGKHDVRAGEVLHYLLERPHEVLALRASTTSALEKSFTWTTSWASTRCKSGIVRWSSALVSISTQRLAFGFVPTPA